MAETTTRASVVMSAGSGLCCKRPTTKQREDGFVAVVAMRCNDDLERDRDRDRYSEQTGAGAGAGGR